MPNQLLDSHTKPHSHTQQVSLLTVRHDDYLLFIRWKWSIMKVFLLLIFTLRRLRRRRKRRVGLAASGEADAEEVEEVEGEAGEAGTRV